MWLLLRQDDNGNVFLVDEYATEAEAVQFARAFTARAHKQIYWVELREAPPRAV